LKNVLNVQESRMNLISHYRKKENITQLALAQQIGWKQPRSANYEAMLRTQSVEDSRRIVAALNALGARCSLDEVFPPLTNG